jgi:DNA-binding transcriptional regulator YiaG
MTNHPNRGAPSSAANPTATMVASARAAAGLTTAQAANLVHSTQRSWQLWESGERRMHPATWELFRIKALLVSA